MACLRCGVRGIATLMQLGFGCECRRRCNEFKRDVTVVQVEEVVRRPTTCHVCVIGTRCVISVIDDDECESDDDAQTNDVDKNTKNSESTRIFLVKQPHSLHSTGQIQG
jgi:hypothetical protein